MVGQAGRSGAPSSSRSADGDVFTHRTPHRDSGGPPERDVEEVLDSAHTVDHLIAAPALAAE
jgi:hypothetical protein